MAVRSQEPGEPLPPERSEAHFDIVFLDINATDDPLQLIETYQDQSISPTIILLADAESGAALQNGLRAGAEEDLQKPIDPDALERAIVKANRWNTLKREKHRAESELNRLKQSPDDDSKPLSPDYLFHVLLDLIPDAVYFKDRDSRFLYISKALADKFGLEDPEDARGKTDFAFFSEEHAEKAYEDEQEIIRTGNPIRNEVEKETWHGKKDTWVSTSKVPLIGPDGEIAGTFGISRDVTRRVRAERELQEHLNRLEEDLERARIVQERLLPSDDLELDGMNLAYRVCTYEQVGGDHFSLLPLDEHQTGLFMGDVAGHGVSAALYLALIKFLTERIAGEYGSEPATFLQELNREFLEVNADSSRFITGFYGYFESDPDSDHVRAVLSKAGHPDPVFIRGTDGSAEFIDIDSQAALGILNDLETTNREVELEPGERLFVYTDGLSEIRDNQESFITREELLELFERCQEPSIDQTVDRIIQSAKAYVEEDEFEDDIILCGIEVEDG